MFFRKTGILLLTAVFLVGAYFPPVAQAGAKRRIAIMPFDSHHWASAVAHVDLGKAIASMLTTKIVNDGTYRVIDRSMLDKVLKEQNLSVSDRADPATACKIGKILSVDAIVVGSITAFGNEKSSTSVSAPTGYIPSVPYVGSVGGLLGSFRSRKSKTRVAIDMKVIDVNTTEVIAAAQGTGMSKRSSGGIGIVSSSTYGDSAIADEATAQAVDMLTQQLVAAAAKIPDNQSILAKDVTGKVADVEGTSVTVNIGKNNGLAVGDKLKIQRAYKTIRDPDTGKVIKEKYNTVAVISLSEVDSTSSTGNIVKGTARVGDVVKRVSTSVSAIIVGDKSGGDKSVTTGGTAVAGEKTANADNSTPAKEEATK